MTDPQVNEQQVDSVAPGTDSDEIQRTYAESSEETPDPAQEELASLRSQLGELQQALERSEQARELDRAFLEAGVLDLPAAHLLLGQLADIQGEAEEVVAELKRHKPYLFRRERAPIAAPTMSPRNGNGRAPVLDAAFSAMSTGKRAELLQYMRLKRHGQRALSA
ncbi:MAG: hypothetical protein ACF8NJ_03255 [Phycisphaerales bacterium JB038]